MKIKLVRAVKAKAVGDFRLALTFSDGSSGVLDMAPDIALGGPMIEPLRDPAFFARVFIEMGVPTWPNGYDIDAINVRMQLEEAGALAEEPAAA